MTTAQLQRTTFTGYMPVSFFEKADAPKGKKRRVRGIATIETVDRQGDLLVQKGISFAPLLSFGALNDNHEKGSSNIVGKPESITFFEKGATLPDGSTAKAACHWFEGWILGDSHSTKLWEKALELQALGEPFGVSVEGAILWRTGPNNKVVAKAVVQNLAITHCPVNPDTTMHAALSKSMTAMLASANGSATAPIEVIETDDALMDGVVELDLAEIVGQDAAKALTVGHGAASEARTGEGAAALLAPDSLETKHMLCKAMAFRHVAMKYPHLSLGEASRLADLALALATDIERTRG